MLEKRHCILKEDAREKFVDPEETRSQRLNMDAFSAMVRLTGRFLEDFMECQDSA